MTRSHDERAAAPGIARRELLRSAVAAAVLGLAPWRALAAPGRGRRPDAQERSLAFHHLHTGENLRVVYWAQGRYLPEALASIDHVLRDHRSGETRRIDLRLLDLLHTLAARVESREAYHVICGYRSPETNAMLAARGSGVARGSLHLEGMAADVFLPDRALAGLRRAALSLRAGGVGYYPQSGFVHVDVGRVRFW